MSLIIIIFTLYLDGYTGVTTTVGKTFHEFLGGTFTNQHGQNITSACPIQRASVVLLGTRITSRLMRLVIYK